MAAGVGLSNRQATLGSARVSGQRALAKLSRVLSNRRSKTEERVSIYEERRVDIDATGEHRAIVVDDERDERDNLHEILSAVARLQRDSKVFREIAEHHELERMLSEAYGLMRALNSAYGWEPGEPYVADRLFGINVRGALAAAASGGVIDFKVYKMIQAMRSVAEGAGGSRSGYAGVAAVRNLVGGMTSNEARLVADAKRLAADDFAEMVLSVDLFVSRAQERATALRLQRPVSPVTSVDLRRRSGRSVADGRILRHSAY